MLQDEINDKQDLINEKMKHANGSDKVKYQEEYLQLLIQEEKLQEDKIKQYEKSLSVYQKELSSYNFKFNENGTISNLSETLNLLKDNKDLDVKTFKVITKKKPEQRELEDMIFAFKVVKHVKSNGIVVAKDLRTIGICGGQTNRVGAVEIARHRVCDSTKEAVVASDGFFPAIDNIQIMAQNRVSAVIQPAGSIKDNEVIEAADKFGISMISTGIRHFKH